MTTEAILYHVSKSIKELCLGMTTTAVARLANLEGHLQAAQGEDPGDPLEEGGEVLSDEQGSGAAAGELASSQN